MADKKNPAPKKKPYTLKNRTFINGKWVEAGSKVDLTEEGRKSFKLKNRI